jgi:hypothetical protein
MLGIVNVKKPKNICVYKTYEDSGTTAVTLLIYLVPHQKKKTDFLHISDKNIIVLLLLVHNSLH